MTPEVKVHYFAEIFPNDPLVAVTKITIMDGAQAHVLQREDELSGSDWERDQEKLKIRLLEYLLVRSFTCGKEHGNG
jgi:hypothetical protein